MRFLAKVGASGPSAAARALAAPIRPLRRRSAAPTSATAVALVLAACATGSGHGAGAQGRASDVDAQRALASYTAMQRYFYSSSRGTYVRTHPGMQRAHAWPVSQALWATVAMTAIPSIGNGTRSALRSRLVTLLHYRHATPRHRAEYASLYGGVGQVYYDDNLWIALALIQTSRILPDPGLVRAARNLFDLVADQWDSNSADPCPGGIFWTNSVSNHDRNAVTTANAALLALQLYGIEHTPSYLAFAVKAYEWTTSCLGRPDGLIADHTNRGGRIDPTVWSYNQGAMIAAGVDLYLTTGNRRFLQAANRTAVAELRRLGNPLGAVDDPAFLAIFYRDLRTLIAADPNTGVRSSIERFASEAWTKARNPATGLFYFGGRGSTLLEQAAMVQIYAELAAG